MLIATKKSITVKIMDETNENDIKTQLLYSKTDDYLKSLPKHDYYISSWCLKSHLRFSYCINIVLLLIILGLSIFIQRQPRSVQSIWCKSYEYNIHFLLIKRYYFLTAHSAPAYEAIEYKIVVFPDNLNNKGSYMAQTSSGVPGNDTDMLWEYLYSCMYNTLVQSWLAILTSLINLVGLSSIYAVAAGKLPNSTVSVPGHPDQYVIKLDVFHQLYCLNLIRKALYPDRYHDGWRDLYGENGTVNYAGFDGALYWYLFLNL
jgi:hypothetical protein